MSASETPVRRCPKCGTELEAQDGVCPHCALSETLADSRPEQGADILSLHDIPPPGQKVCYIGDYELIDVIARGGMGIVYRAHQRSLKRNVALKMLLGGIHASDDFKRRFRQEAEAAAKLQHSNIVRIHEVGEHEGQHYFSMDYIEGRTLAELVREKPVAAERAAQYVRTVAEAIHYAHQQGTLHRDLKPSNVLLDSEDRPHVTDFGLAKQIQAEAGMTATGQMLGTPQYMPPEQVDRRRGAVGPHSDVYGLGAILFHLLTGRAPFVAQTFEATLAQVLQADPVPPRVLNPSVPRDLETIALKCLEKDPAHRYPTSNAVAEDLQRWLQMEPILARPSSLWERSSKWCRRRPVVSILIASLVLAISVGMAGTLFQLRTAMKAQEQTKTKNTALQRLLREAAQSDRLIGQDLFRQGRAPDALVHLARANAYDPDSSLASEIAVVMLNDWSHPIPTAICIGHEAEINSVQFSPDSQRVVTASDDNTVRVWHAVTGKLITTFRGHEAEVQTAQFSPDGRRVVSTSAKTARIWKADSGELLATLQGHQEDLNSAEFSPDGKRVVSASDDKTARVWDASNGALITMLQGHEDDVNSAEFSADGKRVVTASGDETARVWDAQSGQLLTVLKGHGEMVFDAKFSPDGKRVVTASADKTALVWDAQSGQLLTVLKGHGEMVFDAKFSPDGKRVVTTSLDKTARVWDPGDGKLLTTLQARESAEFSPDGQRIITLSTEGDAHVWDARSGKLLATFQGQQGRVSEALFSPDGRRVVTASRDNIVRVWDAKSRTLGNTFQGHQDTVRSAEFSSDGKRLVTASYDKTARVWDAGNGKLLNTLKGHGGALFAAQFSPDGKWVVTASEDKTARLWSADAGNFVAILQGHLDKVLNARFSPDGRHVITASRDGTAQLWDAITGKRLTTFGGHKNTVWSAEFSPDSERIVTTSDKTTTRVWNAGSGKELAKLEMPATQAVKNAVISTSMDDEVLAGQFSPDGRRVVTASGDGMARLSDAGNGNLLVSFRGHEASLRCVQFSPDGMRIVTASDDKTARVWNAISGELLACLQGHQAGVWSAQFSPDGQRVVTSAGFLSESEDTTARVWDANTGKLLGILQGLTSGLLDAHFSPDGHKVVTAAPNHAVRMWELLGTTASPPEWFADFLRLMAQRKFNDDGELVAILPKEFLDLRAKLESSVARDNSRYASIARRFLSPPQESPQSAGPR